MSHHADYICMVVLEDDLGAEYKYLKAQLRWNTDIYGGGRKDILADRGITNPGQARD